MLKLRKVEKYNDWPRVYLGKHSIEKVKKLKIMQTFINLSFFNEI